ncbi:alpha/beta fold hydrolase [Streptomyces hydrogenans]|uniref:Hydrolase n=1 Tax=Streptomyces hydrogenans TaxID=1873719 RepID=A0ABQ3P3I3_9ACTN|nr:alpha/beta hydrolase [Streptomyces hydrogenans]GHG16492.1 hydrolase [Streptomyces hydrogenans]GHI19581.1 hydrolase [Streptomyces hydrogenans]
MARERYVDVEPGVRLWAEEHGDPGRPPLLLVMGAQAPGLNWPDELVALLAARHRVIRYDHRDTGRSTWAFDERPYPLSRLAEDAVAVLDAFGAGRAHVVGMSLGGLLTQLLVADHPDRLLSATVIGTAALSTAPYVRPDGSRVPAAELPGPAEHLLEFWSRPEEDRDLEAELDHRVAHWRALAGDALPFDADWFRAQERRIVAHTGHHRPPTAHARADASGLLRTEELAAARVPTLVISAPAEPVAPPPHAEHLAQVIPGARLAVVPGMGHALPPEVHGPLAGEILRHTERA